MLERAGFSTGYDLDALIATARWIGEAIGRSAPSALSRAGGFPKCRFAISSSDNQDVVASY